MQSEDRPIHFSTELIHPPCKHKVADLQKLYFDLSQLKRAVAYDSTDFSAPSPPRFYSKRGEKTQSIALFLPDRLVFVEEWVDIPLSAYIDKVQTVAGQAMTALNIPKITLQAVTIRTTFALTHFDDARIFLMDHACQQTGRIGPHFQRPVAVSGLRFVLPETPDHPGNLNVTIESFRFSPNEVFVEAKGVYAKQDMAPDRLDAIPVNIQCVRSFISNHVFPYLDQFDSPTEGLV